MSQRQGQLTPRRAAASIAVSVVALAALVAGLEALVRAGDPIPPLEAPATEAEEEVVTCPTPDEVEAEGQPPEVGSEVLIECPSSYDGQRVAYRGEAVRALLDRGDTAWAQLNDDPYALAAGPLPHHRTALGGNSGMPVRISAEIAEQIAYVGDHGTRGDLVEVVGTFRRTGDAGAPAIFAHQGTVAEPGTAIQHEVDPARAVVAFLVAATAFGLTGAAARSRGRGTAWLAGLAARRPRGWLR